MANDIEIVVSGRNDSAATFAMVSRSLASVRKAAEKTWRELDVLAIAAATAALEVTQLGKQLGDLSAAAAREATTAVDELGGQAESSARAVDELAGKTRDLAAGVAAAHALEAAIDDVGDKARKAARDVDDIGDEAVGAAAAGIGSRVAGAFGELGDLAGKALSGIGESITSGLSELPGVLGSFFGTTGPVGIAVAGALAAGLSAAVMLAISAAGIGALAGAAITAGIVGAAQDQRILSAFQVLKESITSELGDIGRPFIGPLVAAMKSIKEQFGNLDLARSFAPLANTINPIVDGLFQMAQAALPGINSMLKAAVPLILQVVSEMPRIGETVGEFADALADAGPGAAMFFHQLVTLVDGFMFVFGDMVRGMGAFAEFFGGLAEKVGLIDLGGARFTDLAGSGVDAYGQLAGGAAAFTNATLESVDSVRSLKDQMDQLTGAAVSGMDAEAAFQAALDSASDSIARNGQNLDLSTNAGRNNWAALRELQMAVIDNAQAAYDMALQTGNAEIAGRAAADEWNRGVVAYTNTAAAMYGSRDAAERLANRMLVQPPNWRLSATMDTSQVEAAIYRVHQAVANAGAQVGYAMSTAYAQLYYNQAAGRARGGPVREGETYIVGENQPELFVPTEDGVILPQVPRPGSGTPWGGGGYAPSAPAVSVTVYALDPRGAADAVMSALQEWERSNGTGWRS